MSEYIDLVDSTGRIAKRNIARDDSTRYGDLHMQIAVAVLFRGNELLVHARSHKKRVNPGDIDHVCGGIAAGESPLEAAMREAEEETGLVPHNLRLVADGVNEYNRYRYLFIGEVDGVPKVDPNEIEWIGYFALDDLRQKHQSGELTFVDGFFADLDLAVSA